MTSRDKDGPQDMAADFTRPNTTTPFCTRHDKEPAMRKIISKFFITLDGAVEAPNEWSLRFWNDEIQEAPGAGMARSDATLLGRVTYEEFAAVWAGRTSEDDAGADHMNTTRKYVVSRTLTETPWANSTLLSGDPLAAVAELKASEGQDIITSGSATPRAQPA
jgi:dihydrofolate reductase